MVIVGHTSPDWDCIGAIWLLMRYGGMEGADVRFVNTGNPDRAVLDGADAAVDTGREYDPTRLRFDHHHLPGAAASETCATFQVLQHLAPNGELVHLAPLNALILHGDTGSRMYGAEWSRLVGIHALLSVRKARKAGDVALLAWGMDVLDDLAEHLKARYEAKEALAVCTVYHSQDGLVVALDNALHSYQTTQAAFEDGARIVVFHSEYPDIPTVAVGAQRAPESAVDIGAIVADICGGAVIRGPVDEAVLCELLTWYRHPSGFYSGRGSPKAPNGTPLEIGLDHVARAIDAAWQR